jgi:hypothetical protein
MDHNDLVTVYTLGDPIKADIIKNALHAEGIRCFLEGHNQAGDPLNLMSIDIKIQVPAADADRAARFIQKHEEKRQP